MSSVSRRHSLRFVARTRSRDSRVEWIAISIVLLVLAVVFVMTAKPGAGGSSATLIVAFFAGIAAAVPFWRTAPQTETPAVTEPAA